MLWSDWCQIHTQMWRSDCCGQYNDMLKEFFCFFFAKKGIIITENVYEHWGKGEGKTSNFPSHSPCFYLVFFFFPALSRPTPSHITSFQLKLLLFGWQEMELKKALVEEKQNCIRTSFGTSVSVTSVSNYSCDPQINFLTNNNTFPLYLLLRIYRNILK